jgi:hypothetical protein
VFERVGAVGAVGPLGAIGALGRWELTWMPVAGSWGVSASACIYPEVLTLHFENFSMMNRCLRRKTSIKVATTVMALPRSLLIEVDP